MTRERVNGRALRALAALWIAGALLALTARVAQVAVASEASILRREAPLTNIQREQGAAYVAPTGRPELSSHEGPSSARVLEDGRPLGPANALHDTIRQTGRGHFSFWHDYVYLSASDNTDPRTNGRLYTLDYPVLNGGTIAAIARAGGAVSLAALLLSVALLAMRVRPRVVTAVRSVPALVRSAGRVAQSVAALWVLAALCGVLATVVFLVRTGSVMWVWPQVAIAEAAPEQGAGYVASLGREDLSSHREPSPARILEDGRSLGPGNSQHADVRQEGRGRYSFWYDYVLFSASDNTDPRSNGRRYAVTYPPVGRTAAQTLYAAAAFLMLAAVVASVFALGARWAALIAALVAAFDRLGDGAGSVGSWAQGRLRRGRHAVTWRGPAGVVLMVALWVLTGALVLASREVYLAQTGQSMRLWASAPLQGFVEEMGYAYVAPTRRPDLSSHVQPSAARVLENGVPLASANAQHVDIRDQGQGRYSFWHDYVIFAASDNTDPRSNGRTYTIAFPEVGAAEGRVLFALLLFVGGAALLSTGLMLRTRAFGEMPVRALKRIWAARATVLVGASALLLLVIPMMRAGEVPPALVKVAWVVTFAMALAASLAVRRASGVIPTRAVAVLLIALGVGYGILTAAAPHKWQGCRATEPTPAWDAFCVAPDSASYYLGYQPGSTRNPLYPWLIKAVTSGTGFNPSAYRDQARAAALVTNPADPLFRVVRTQIVLLLAAGLALAAAAMVVLRSLLPAAVMLALYDYGFFIAYELNVVLTEPLVQAATFLVVAAFLLFMIRPRTAWLLVAAACCGAAYLTRQAAAYTALFVAVMAAVALLQDWRRWWKPAAAAVALLAAIVSIPDVYTFAKTGSLTRSQESLQYQYRIAHAMQYATMADLELMPNAATRRWLANAIPIRDAEHRMVETKYSTRYDRMIYYINQNLYAVAMPTYDPQWVEKLPLAEGNYARISEFYMAVATPILERHWPEYLRFGFDFWRLGLSYAPVSRVQAGPLSAWTIYALLGLVMIALRDRYAAAAATLIVAHWAHVALASLFAAPIPRMVWASEFMVALAALILIVRAGTVFVGRRAAVAVAAPEEVLA